MLRIPYCLENRLTDGGKIASPTRRPPSTPQKHYFLANFCKRPSAAGVIRQIETKNVIHIIGSQTRDFPACNIAPQSLRYRVPQKVSDKCSQLFVNVNRKPYVSPDTSVISCAAGLVEALLI
jgi:hypothetical protein